MDSVGITVSEIDRSVDFYAKVLSLEKVSDVEVWGETNSSVSPGVISVTEAALGFTKGLLVRDPDGQVMQVIQR